MLKSFKNMEGNLKKEGRYSYYEAGEGTPIVVLHGLMGGLSNFNGVAAYFSTKGYKIVIPELPIYTQNILKTNVKAFAKYVKDFITFKGFDRVILLGNSLGGHIALYHSKMYPEKVAGLVITGSSGLYESAMGDSYPRRGDYEYIQKKAEAVFYDPKIATKEIVDEVFATVNDTFGVEAITVNVPLYPAGVAPEINTEELTETFSDVEYVTVVPLPTTPVISPRSGLLRSAA
jgi:pimeloyl-ACP methyl ester carboxylesterase